MSELGKRKKEFLKAYNNLCSCYGDIVSEQTKTSCNLEIKNTQLKELLKECREHLIYIVICPQNKKIVEKINQALGEDK